MKKFFLIVCMTLSLIACDKQESDKPIVKVGASLPLTGNMSHIGISAKNALQMAIDKWNAIDTKFKYQLIVEDDAFEAKKSQL